MNYTLDTAAIRKRFDRAVVAWRDNGTILILVPTADLSWRWFNLIDGLFYETTGDFRNIIRPGDRCEFGYVGDDRWWKGTYRGCRLDMYMFQSDIEITKDGFGMYSTIRPLPTTEAKPETCPEIEAVKQLVDEFAYKYTRLRK